MRREKDARQAASHASALSSAQAFAGDCSLHPTLDDAALSVQCDSPAGFENSGLAKLCHAAGRCANCPDSNRPESGLTANDSIAFFAILPSPLSALLCRH